MTGVFVEPLRNVFRYQRTNLPRKKKACCEQKQTRHKFSTKQTSNNMFNFALTCNIAMISIPYSIMNIRQWKSITILDLSNFSCRMVEKCPLVWPNVAMTGATDITDKYTKRH